jgi:RNA polymerase sigma factor (sigma-70 family)
MRTSAMNRVLRQIHRVATLDHSAGLADGDLLDNYITRRDDDAFETLVRRHGPMVFAVCRRILCNDADAEDAFQATFLVLVRKATSIRPRGMVGNWLHGVARTTALKARAMRRKRSEKETEAAKTSKPAAAEEIWLKMETLVDDELSHLPDKYRIPIVICDLEGTTVAEAARNLGWPYGTVATRLARGRALLARRLSARGLSISSGALGVLLAQGVSHGALPTSLVSHTVRAAGLYAGSTATTGVVATTVAALTEGVLRAMLLKKLKIASAVLLVTTLACLGVGAIIQHAFADSGDQSLHLAQDVNRGAHDKSDESDQPKEREAAPHAKEALERTEAAEKGKSVECTGRITNQATEKPVAGASVSIRWDLAKGDHLFEITKHQTDAQGKYTFVVPPEKMNAYVVVQVAHPDFVGRKVFSGFAAALRKVANDKLDAELDPGQAITGMIRMPSGEPAAGVRVVAVSRKATDTRQVLWNSGNDGGFWSHARTDAKGRFQLKVATPGPAVFWIVPDKHAASEHRLNDKERGDVGAFTLAPGASITGKVVDVKGKPLPGVNVNAARLEVPEKFVSLLGLYWVDVGGSAITNAKGEFTIDALAPGQYKVNPAISALGAFVLQIVGEEASHKKHPLPDFFEYHEVTVKEGMKPQPIEIRGVPTVEIAIQYIDSTGKPIRSGPAFGAQLQGEFEKKRCDRLFTQDPTGIWTAKVPHGVERVQLLMQIGNGPFQYRLKKGDKLQDGRGVIDLGTVIDDITIEIFRPEPKKAGVKKI